MWPSGRRMVPSECAPVGFWPLVATSGRHVDTQLPVQMKRPLVSALSEYKVRPLRLTSTVFPSAWPVLTVFAEPAELLDPDALASAANIANAAVSSTAVPMSDFRFKFMHEEFHRAGRLHKR